MLRELGFRAHEARLAADTFRRHDLAALDAMRPHPGRNPAHFTGPDRAGRTDDLFERDREIRERERTGGWVETPSINQGRNRDHRGKDGLMERYRLVIPQIDGAILATLLH